MADLIDGQALIEALGEQMDRCSLTYLWGLDKAVTTANKLPAVDAVEVVRCKDCEYRGGTGLCALDTYAFEVVDDGFCSYGKRREEDAAD